MRTRPPREKLIPVIPAGRGTPPQDAERARTQWIMFGPAGRKGLPEGWHLVAINGRHLYARFVAVALNVLKAAPVDTPSEPNLLTDERQALFGGTLPSRPRVRFVRQTGAAVWEIHRA